jgi:hypothetical protein
MGWSPEDGFLEADWSGYDGGMLLYVLALGSPTHAIDARAWDAWARSYRWEGEQVAFGPLFGHQYSHVWIDFRGIQDAYMRAKGIDYFVNSTRATHANRAYCIANPGGWKGYGELVWGLTASDGPGADAAGGSGASRFHAYWARGAAPGGAADAAPSRPPRRAARCPSRPRWPSPPSCTCASASGIASTDGTGSTTR